MKVLSTLPYSLSSWPLGLKYRVDLMAFTVFPHTSQADLVPKSVRAKPHSAENKATQRFGLRKSEAVSHRPEASDILEARDIFLPGMNGMNVAFWGFHFLTHEIPNGCKPGFLPCLWTHLCDFEAIYLRREQEVEDAMAIDN